MKAQVGVVNYGLGNIGSLYSALRFVNSNVGIINEPVEICSHDVIVLSGVGNFSSAVKKLKGKGFWDEILNHVLNKNKPILGVCLGMQMFADKSYENGEHEGFGFIKGKVVKIDVKNLKLPRIGWFQVDVLEDEGIFNGMRYGSFYFMHSYHFVPDNMECVIATSKYGELQIVSAVREHNVVGFQFHPEKSQGDGLRVLKNTLRLVENVF